jgi:class 3 adenylate cyclase/tetratricopeptide (TPR) repeat protein
VADLPSGHVTFCFTDIEGSSAVNAALGDERYRGVLDRHRELLREAWTARGGVEVSTDGDGCFIVFDDASAAVTSCADAQRLLGAEPWPTGTSIRVRMGVHSGSARPTIDRDYVSLAVSQAARVASCAHGGQVIVSAATACDVDAGMLRPLGRYRLRDFADPVELFQLTAPGIALDFPPPRGVRALDLAAGSGVPSWLRVAGRQPFVGRHEELALIADAVAAVTDGDRRGVFIGGEPGVGKTHLVAEAAAQASGRGVVVLGGRCEPGMANPFGIVTDALRQVLAAVDPTVLPSMLGRWPEELTRVVPELSELLPELGPRLVSDPETERWRLLDAIASAMAGIAAPGGLMLVVDDVQWAPRATIDVLRHLLRDDGPERLLVLGTHRDADTHVSPAWRELLAESSRSDHLERRALTGLDRDAIRELVATCTGHPAERAHALAETLHRLTDGNAFFAIELLRDLVARGDVVLLGGQLDLTPDRDVFDLPNEVADVIHERVASLGSAVERTLTAAAVAAGESDFSVAVVERVVDGRDPLDDLERASHANLVVEVGSGVWRFVHALVATTLYRAASQTRRDRMHRVVAIALEQSDAAPAIDIAHHWSLASGQDAAVAATRWFVRAGRDAMDRLAPGEAVVRLRAALEHDDRAGSSRLGEAQRLDLRIELGAALRRAGDPSSSDVLTAVARDALARQRPDLMGRALVTDTRGFWNSIGRYDNDRVTMIDDALRHLSDSDTELRARLLASLASELLFHPSRDARFELADEALAMARRLGDPPTIFDIALQRVLATSSPDRVDELWASSDDLVRLADEIADPHRRVLAIMARYFVGLQAGHVADAAPATADALAVAGDLGQPMLLWLVGALRAGLLEFEGGLAHAESTALEALGHGQRAGEADAFVWFSGQLTATRLQQDRLAEIIDLLVDFVAANPELRAWHAVLSLAMCELGRFDEAGAAFEELSSDHFRSIPNDQLRTATLCLAAEACRHVGERTDAADLYDLLAPWAHHHGSMAVFSTGSVERPLGVLATMLGDLDRAERHLRHAISNNADAGSPLWAATAMTDLAALQLIRADIDAASATIELAESQARQLAAHRLVRICHRLREMAAQAGRP